MLLPLLTLSTFAALAPSTGRSARTAKAAKSLLYVAVTSGAGGEVDIFNQSGQSQKPLGRITQGIDAVYGLFVDAQGNLYAANAYNDTVTVYAPGSTSPSTTLTSAAAPVAVAMDHGGNVYVASKGNAQNPDHAAVLVYAKGQTTPSSTLVGFKKGAYPIGLAFDSAGDLYVAYNRRYRGSRPQGAVLKFAPGSSGGTNLKIHVGAIGEIAVDGDDNLLVVDETNNSIDVFAPGSNVRAQQIGGFPFASIFGVTLNSSNDEIWVTNGFWPYIYGVTYPTGQIVDTITLKAQGFITGVAASPAGRTPVRGRRSLFALGWAEPTRI